MGYIQLYDVPSMWAPHFISKRALLAYLKILFEHSSPTSSPLVVVLIGMGGTGKMQLAIEYCRHLKDLRFEQYSGLMLLLTMLCIRV
jgi:pantothenate kinase-related protein Tda10